MQVILYRFYKEYNAVKVQQNHIQKKDLGSTPSKQADTFTF